MSKVPYLMHADALLLKATAENAMLFNSGAHVAISCVALLSLIEQAHSPQLGLATTKEIRDELEARGPDSPEWYRTFDGDDADKQPSPAPETPAAQPEFKGDMLEHLKALMKTQETSAARTKTDACTFCGGTGKAASTDHKGVDCPLCTR